MLGDDAVKSYFGFREVGVGKNANGDAYVTLNGKPIYLQLCLDQTYHPQGYYTFPTDEFMKNEIELQELNWKTKPAIRSRLPLLSAQVSHPCEKPP